MKTFMIVLTILLAATSGFIFAEETPKEGAISVTTSYNSAYTAMPMGKDLQLTFDAFGVAVADSELSPFHHSSVRILGSGLVVKGSYTEVGSTVWTLTDGSQIFGTYEGKGVGAGKLKGSCNLIGGTGKFAGITGGGDIEGFNVPKPAMKGTVQGYIKLTGNWKLLSSQ